MLYPLSYEGSTDQAIRGGAAWRPRSVYRCRSCASCRCCPPRRRSCSRWARARTSSASRSNATIRRRRELVRVVSNTTLAAGLTPAQIDDEVRARVAAGDDLYHLDEGALRELSADLVVTQDLCAVCAVDVTEVDDALRHLGCRADVLTVDPMTLDDVLESIVVIGKATRCEDRGRGARPRSPPPLGIDCSADARHGSAACCGAGVDRSAVLRRVTGSQIS